MNETIKHQLDHRTIRFFKEQPVEQSLLEQFWAVMNRTATSNGLQLASVIRITDKTLKKELSEICTQPYVANIPELYVFIVDTQRIRQIGKEKGYQGYSYRSMDFFTKGFTDAVLMAQNLTNAVESTGLGAVYLGSILNDIQATINLLQLPLYTFPVLGLGFGYPNDVPQLKPRMSMTFKIHENLYQEKHNYLSLLEEYDQEMTHYYDTRDKNRRVDTYTNQVLKFLENPITKREDIVNQIAAQGYDLKIKE